MRPLYRAKLPIPDRYVQWSPACGASASIVRRRQSPKGNCSCVDLDEEHSADASRQTDRLEIDLLVTAVSTKLYSITQTAGPAGLVTAPRPTSRPPSLRLEP